MSVQAKTCFFTGSFPSFRKSNISRKVIVTATVRKGSSFIPFCPSDISMFCSVVRVGTASTTAANRMCMRRARTNRHRRFTSTDFVQFYTLRRADEATRIDFFLGTEGFTGTFFRLCVGRSSRVPVVLRVANLANIGARCSLCGVNIAAGFVAAQAAIHLVFMLAG